MILDYVDEKETPHLNRQERLMILIYLLGITNQRQLQIITGWSKKQISEAVIGIRKGTTKKQKDEWLECWQTKPTEPYLYKLGQLGIEYVTALRDESLGNGRKKKKPHQRGHWAHLVGFNEILCRLIENQVDFKEFLVGKEVLSYLYSEAKEWSIDRDGVIEFRRNRIPFRPDGLVETEKEKYFIEYDTGTESRTRILGKLENYLQTYSIMNEMHPVLWVCRTETRKKAIERYAKELKEKLLKSRNKPDFPTMYCAVEGADTKFLAGELDLAPFWQ